MIALFKRSAAALPAVALVLSCAVAGAGELNPAAVTYKLPDQIQWSAPSPAGAQSALLAGDPTKEGLYVQLVKWPAGNHFSHPHFHPHDRFITVIKGTWWVSLGSEADVYNPDKMTAVKQGSFIFEPAFGHHYDQARDEEVIVQIMGTGPGEVDPARE